MKYKKTDETIQTIVKNGKCLLLDIIRKPYLSIKFVCECGNEYIMRLNAFEKGMRCYNCGINKHRKAISGPGNGKYRHDRDQYFKEQKEFQKSYYFLTECKKHKNKIRQLDINRLGYSGIELFYRLTTHKNWISTRFNKEKWHIDHIFPIRAFYDYGITDLKIINALDNLQPLTNAQNSSKGKNYNLVEFQKYLKSKGIIV